MVLTSFAGDALPALHPLLTTSFGAPVSLADERRYIRDHDTDHWLVAWDDERIKPLGFARDFVQPGGWCTGELHASPGPAQGKVFQTLLTRFLSIRHARPLRFALDPDALPVSMLEERGFRTERFLSYGLDLMAESIPGSNAVRSAEPDDAEAIHRILRPDGGASADWVRSAIADGRVVVTTGVVRGAIRIEVANGDAEVVELRVLPEVRRRGMGRRLLGAACRLAEARGAARMSLWVEAHNHGARAMYVGFGFQPQPKQNQVWLGSP